MTMPVIKAPHSKLLRLPSPRRPLPPRLLRRLFPRPSLPRPRFILAVCRASCRPNARGPATIAAIGNPYGGMNGPVGAPHGVVGSTGIGGAVRTPNSGVTGKVASAGIPGMATPMAAQQAVTKPATTDLEVLSKPSVQYTPEAKQLRVQGDVVLRVTFTATGQCWCKASCMGLATASMKRLAGWLSRYDSGLPPVTEKRLT